MPAHLPTQLTFNVLIAPYLVCSHFVTRYASSLSSRRFDASWNEKKIIFHPRGSENCARGGFCRVRESVERLRERDTDQGRVRVLQSDLRTRCATARTRYTYPGCSHSLLSFRRPLHGLSLEFQSAYLPIVSLSAVFRNSTRFY